jgi:adenylate cyclase 8
MIAGCLSAVGHIIVTSVELFDDSDNIKLEDNECKIRRIAANTLLYIAVNFAGMYTKYLTDRSQRKAFLETHRSMETRYRTQSENDKQEKLLLSGESRKIWYQTVLTLLQCCRISLPKR